MNSKFELDIPDENLHKMEKIEPNFIPKKVSLYEIMQRIQYDIIYSLDEPNLKLEMNKLNYTITQHPDAAKLAFKDLVNYVNDKPSIFNTQKLNEIFSENSLVAQKKETLKDFLNKLEFKVNKNDELYLCLNKTELAQDNHKTNEYSKGLVIIGNIAPDTIKINKENGIATYSIAVSQGKDKEPSWCNCTTFNPKQFDKLQEIKDKGTGIQVSLKGSIQKNAVESKDGKKYYTNLITNALEPTTEFTKPIINLFLNGKVYKEMETITKNEKEFCSLTIEVQNNTKKEFYNLISSNKDQINILKGLKKGDDIKIEKAHINSKGQISINKNTIINDKQVQPSKVKQQNER